MIAPPFDEAALASAAARLDAFAGSLTPAEREALGVVLRRARRPAGPPPG
ncbi:MAG: hypothetical protein ICV64_03545, partial [Thermoleophilia bacterium]|nr:hypothetical protein [Thermoleophilia bacterium]